LYKLRTEYKHHFCLFFNFGQHILQLFFPDVECYLAVEHTLGVAGFCIPDNGEKNGQHQLQSCILNSAEPKRESEQRDISHTFERFLVNTIDQKQSRLLRKKKLPETAGYLLAGDVSASPAFSSSTVALAKVDMCLG
jgi:hypothetical protein